ncbi:hypothetical protein GW17_00036087 [Ensete ventricosum]|nr:hypothetical protein GW17_00036087 [Ensete ventricosum]
MWDPPPRYPPLDVNSRARLRPIAYLSYERYAVGVPHGAPYNSPFLGETKKRGALSNLLVDTSILFQDLEKTHQDSSEIWKVPIFIFVTHPTPSSAPQHTSPSGFVANIEEMLLPDSLFLFLHWCVAFGFFWRAVQRSVRSAEEKSQAGGGMTVRSIGWADSIDMADKMSTSMMSSADGPENNGS